LFFKNLQRTKTQHNVGEIFTIGNDIRCIMSENIKLHSYKTSDLFGTRIKANVRNVKYY